MTIKSKLTKRQSIIKAATKMFLEHGYRNISMDKIAQAAPVSKATLYNHFENKNALLAGVVSRLCESLFQTMALISIDSDTVEDTLKKIARSYVDLIYSEEALDFYRLVIAESREFPELSQLVYESGPQPALKQLEDYLQRLNASSRFKCDDLAFSADVFFSLLEGDLYMKCLLGVKPSPTAAEKHKFVNQVVAFYQRGMQNADH